VLGFRGKSFAAAKSRPFSSWTRTGASKVRDG